MRFSLWRAWAFALRERSGRSFGPWGSGEGDALSEERTVAEVFDLVGGMTGWLGEDAKRGWRGRGG